MKVNNKMGKHDNLIVGAVVIGIIALAAGWIPILGTATPGAAQTGAAPAQGQQYQQAAPASGPIQTITDTTLKLSPYDHYAPGAIVDTEGVVISNPVVTGTPNSGNSALTGSFELDSGALSTATVTLAPSKNVTIALWANRQTTDVSGNAITVASDKNWYGTVVNYQLANASTDTFTIPTVTNPNTLDGSTLEPKTLKGLFSDGAVTVYTKNQDGSVNSASNQFNMSASDTQTLTFYLKGPSKSCFGDPYAMLPNPTGTTKGIVMDLNYNTSQIDRVSIAGASSTGITYDMAGIAEESYELPISALCNSDERAFNMEITSGGSYAATVVTARIRDPQLYYQEDGGTVPVGFRFAVVDETDKLDLGTGNPENILAYAN
jgi:hypothetical protein